MKSNHCRWLTSDEIEYLNGIGTHRRNFEGVRDSVSPEEKARLLRGALLAYSRRTRWEALDRNVICRHAEFLLATFAGPYDNVEAGDILTPAPSGVQI